MIRPTRPARSIRRRVLSALAAAATLAIGAPTHAQFRLESDDGRLDVRGRMQAGYNYRILHDSDDDHDKNRFRLKNFRFSLVGDFFEDYSAEVAVELNGDAPDGSKQPEAKDLYVEWNGLDWLGVRVGQFKAPISRDRMTGGGKLLFTSRPRVASDFTPGRDIGAMATLSTSDGHYSAQIGAFNNRGSNQTEDDSVGTPLIALRLETMPWANVKSGEGDVRRTRKLAVSFAANAAYADDGESAIFEGEANTAHSINGTKLLYGGDATVKYRGFFFSGELLMAYYEPNQGTAYHAGGYLLQSGYYIDSLRIEPAIRFDDFNPSNRVPDDRESTFTLGLNAYPMRSHELKAMLNYTRHLPRGVFTSNPASDGWKEDEIFLMVQLAFK